MEIGGKLNILALKQGDKAEFETLYRLYYRDLYRFAYNYIMSRDAEDIVQEVYVKFYENRKNLPLDIDIKSYLYSSTKNSCLNFLRHLNVVDKSKTKLAEVILSYSDELSDEDNERYHKVKECLNKLSEQQQNILRLKAEGYDYKEIGEKLNISPVTVKTHVVRAYKFIRKSIFFLISLFFTIFLYTFFLR